MIGNISPCLSSSENTLNTLRYSDRVKDLKKKVGTGVQLNVSIEQNNNYNVTNNNIGGFKVHIICFFLNLQFINVIISYNFQI